jgi:hypothetical protein
VIAQIGQAKRFRQHIVLDTRADGRTTWHEIARALATGYEDAGQPASMATGSSG